MRKERLIRGLLAFALGSTVATQVLAYQLHYAPVLGTPMLHAGIYNVYLPTQGWQWASWWGWSHPGTFTTAGLVLVGITAGLTLLPARKPPQEPDSATWCDFAGEIMRLSSVLGGPAARIAAPDPQGEAAAQGRRGPGEAREHDGTASDTGACARRRQYAERQDLRLCGPNDPG